MTRIPCPSDNLPWEDYDDTSCACCGTRLPDEDPGIQGIVNQLDSWWQDGFCSASCLLADIKGSGVTWDTAKRNWSRPGFTGLPDAVLRGFARREDMTIRSFADLCGHYGIDVEVGEPLPNGWRPEGGYAPDADGGTHPATPGEAEALALRRLKRTFFKYTTAGLPVEWESPNQYDWAGVFIIAPYCEGSDGLDMDEGERIRLPCSPAQLDAAEKACEQRSQDEWDRTHGCEKCWNGETVVTEWGDEAGPEDYGMRPVDPECPSCEGHGIVI